MWLGRTSLRYCKKKKLEDISTQRYDVSAQKSVQHHCFLDPHYSLPCPHPLLLSSYYYCKQTPQTCRTCRLNGCFLSSLKCIIRLNALILKMPDTAIHLECKNVSFYKHYSDPFVTLISFPLKIKLPKRLHFGSQQYTAHFFLRNWERTSAWLTETALRRTSCWRLEMLLDSHHAAESPAPQLRQLNQLGVYSESHRPKNKQENTTAYNREHSASPGMPEGIVAQQATGTFLKSQCPFFEMSLDIHTLLTFPAHSD